MPILLVSKRKSGSIIKRYPFLAFWILLSSAIPALAQYERVISLAPHLTEMIFSAGAGYKLVGVVDYSDFPEAAKQIPSVGGYGEINYEKIISLKPDVIFAWSLGNTNKDISRLESFGLKVIKLDTQKIRDIPENISRIGHLLGTQTTSDAISDQLQLKLKNLQQQYQNTDSIKVFYQVWDKPMITAGGSLFISEAISLCGGNNIFADQKDLSPIVNLESVIKRDPEVILLGGKKQIQKQWKQYWMGYPQISAVKRQHVFLLNADFYQRPTERLINALPDLCKTIDQARN